MNDLIEEAAKAMATADGWEWDWCPHDTYRHMARAVFSRLDALGYAVVPKEPVTQAFDPATAAAPCQIDGCRYSARDEEIARLKEALRACLNYLENTESDFGITLSSADRARAALKGENNG